MVDFRELDPIIIKHKYCLTQIKKLLLHHYPYETGGLVNKDLNIYHYESEYKDCHHFHPPSIFFQQLISKKDWLFSFHSHLHILKPSDDDLFFMESFNLPILIYSLNYNSFLRVNLNNETDFLAWNI